MDNPGVGPQQNSEIRSYMRDNPTTQAEFEYAQAYIKTLTRDTNVIHRVDVSIRNSY